VRPLVLTGPERVVGGTSCTLSRKQSWRNVTNEVSVDLSWATSVVFGRMTRTANLGIGGTTGISTCTGRRLTVSRRFSTTRRKPRGFRAGTAVRNITSKVRYQLGTCQGESGVVENTLILFRLLVEGKFVLSHDSYKQIVCHRVFVLECVLK